MHQNNKGSILLYTLFLTSFLVLFFISFQGEIEKQLDTAVSLGQNTEEISSTRDALVSLKGNPEANESIGGSDSISLVSLSQSGNVFSQNLEWTGSFEYQMTSTGGASAITLDIREWGPIRYMFATFDRGSESSAVLASSWILTNHAIIGLTSLSDQGMLVLEWLGGHARYSLDASTATIVPEKSSYQKIQDISGYSKTVWLYDVVHFTPKTRTNFPYESLGMYLKQ